jgi:hypothetical protein
MCHTDEKRHSEPSIGEEWNYERITGEITIKIGCRHKNYTLHFAKQT